ncbi:tRNA 5-methoxyuridine(34)/uridine 5-oxyacetic acid(34) synthase CmoB [Thermoproteota archaeon]
MHPAQQFLTNYHSKLLENLPYHKGRINISLFSDRLSLRASHFSNPNIDRFFSAFEKRPLIKPTSLDLNQDCIKIGNDTNITPHSKAELTQCLQALVPWRKGPYNIFGIELDAEWRSDMKWNRLQAHLPDMENKRILDIGCNNGYYMFRMAPYNPYFILGIDPGDLCFMQFQLLQSYIQAKNSYMAPLRLENMTAFKAYFDVVFCMGILYHQRSPIHALNQIHDLMKPKSHLILETLIIPGESETSLFPKETYGMMRNVYFIPTVKCLKNWLTQTGFSHIKLISIDKTTSDEQRVTPWTFDKSLIDFLDPADTEKTAEGYPAPIRVIISANS